ncbi:hypothetical protein [Rhodanobacter glycinis]|uniref:hypothetical protein n=1 Tax=Rhodanobacter glycinis TaxID=582702 RepID=UPI001127C666|nr:hypothetical protein [Rhodanobacter glycinis]
MSISRPLSLSTAMFGLALAATCSVSLASSSPSNQQPTQEKKAEAILSEPSFDVDELAAKRIEVSDAPSENGGYALLAKDVVIVRAQKRDLAGIRRLRMTRGQQPTMWFRNNKSSFTVTDPTLVNKAIDLDSQVATIASQQSAEMKQLASAMRAARTYDRELAQLRMERAQTRMSTLSGTKSTQDPALTSQKVAENQVKRKEINQQIKSLEASQRTTEAQLDHAVAVRDAGMKQIEVDALKAGLNQA